MTRRPPVRRPARGLVLVALACLCAASLPTAALASDRRELRVRSLERLATVHARMMEGGLERSVRGAAAEVGLELPAIPAESPGSFAEAVAQLRGAVELAGELVVEAVPARLDPVVRSDLLARARGGTLTEADFLLHGIDRRRMAEAGLLLARSLDAALPVLESHARTIPVAADAVGCDQLAQGPVCVGGTGANTYTQDYALLIDLGGDDVHANSAGGADRVGNALPVSVALDLGGNDRYETTLPTASGSRVAQGAGSSGIGMLVDAAGSDTYGATSTTAGTNMFAQGYSGIGLGVLQDLEGNDTYRISYRPSRSPASRIQGQGFSSFGVAGVLVDRAGNDTYLSESTTPVTLDDQGRLNPGRPLLQSMGFGEAGGAGIFADGGGTDSMTIRGTSGVVQPDEAREVVPAGAYAEGFGFSTLGGTGLALAGSGDTTWSMSTTAEGPSVISTNVFGFGYASSGGFAGMLDAGGDDAYTADTRAISTRRVQVGDGCSCKAAGASLEGGDAQIRGGGWGGAGVGVLQDEGGNDRYTFSALSRTEAIADDRHSVPASPAAQAYAVGGVSDIHALGYGSLGGAGFLHDRSGDDVYDANSASHVSASATAAASPATREATVEGGRAQTWAQGFGTTGAYGELRDGGGSDVYRATADATTIAEPSTDTSVALPAERILSAQGSVEVQPINGAPHPVGGLALLLNADQGRADTFTAIPADAACTGTRGEGVWKDCGPIAGIGIST